MFNQWEAEESAAVNDASLVDVIIPVRRSRNGSWPAPTSLTSPVARPCDQPARASLPAEPIHGLRLLRCVDHDRSNRGRGLGAANARFEARDVATWDAEGELDLVTVST